MCGCLHDVSVMLVEDRLAGLPADLLACLLACLGVGRACSSVAVAVAVAEWRGAGADSVEVQASTSKCQSRACSCRVCERCVCAGGCRVMNRMCSCSKLQVKLPETASPPRKRERAGDVLSAHMYMYICSCLRTSSIQHNDNMEHHRADINL